MIQNGSSISDSLVSLILVSRLVQLLGSAAAVSMASYVIPPGCKSLSRALLQADFVLPLTCRWHPPIFRLPADGTHVSVVFACYFVGSQSMCAASLR